MPPARIVSPILALVAACCYGLAFLFIRRAQMRGARAGTELLAVSLVNLAGAAALVALRAVVGRGGGPLPLSAEGLGWFAVAGVLTAFLGRQFVVWAMPFLGPSRAAAFKSLAPVLTALVAAVSLGESLRAPLLAGAVLVTLGLWRMNTERAAGGPPLAGTRLLAGVLLGVASALCWSGGYVTRRLGLAALPAPEVGVAVGALITVVLVLAMNLPRLGVPRSAAWFGAAGARPTLLWAGLLSTGGQLAAFTALWLTEATALAVVFISLDPLFMLLASRAVVGRSELITGRTVVSMVIALTGCALALAG